MCENLLTSVTLTPHLLFAIALVVLFPLADLAAMLRLRKYTSTPARLHVYRLLLALLWGGTVVCALVLGHAGIVMVFSPLRSTWTSPHTPAFWVVAALVAGYAAIGVLNGVRVIAKPARRPAFTKLLHKMRFMLPVTAPERRLWIGVSISAGLCEEFLYRGFLLHFFAGALPGGPHLTLVLALLLTTIAFGTAHFYQGVSAAISATVAGLIFGLIAILSHGLWLPMLLHALADWQVLAMYHPLADAPDKARKLIDGTNPFALTADSSAPNAGT